MPKSNRYLTIHPTTHETAIRAKKTSGYFCVPLSVERETPPTIHQIVRYEIFYPEHRKRCQTAGVRVAASIAPPDPLTASVAILIWQGIVQGATWDSLKIVLSSFWATAVHLFQSGEGEKSSVCKLSGALSTPRGRYSFFLELKRAAKKRSPEQCQAVLDGVLHQPKMRTAKKAMRTPAKKGQA